MPTLKRFSGSCIVLHAGDHLLPHVHVKRKDGRDCAVDIDSLAVKERISEREIRSELKWIGSGKSGQSCLMSGGGTIHERLFLPKTSIG